MYAYLLALSVVLPALIFGVLLFLPAHTLLWPRAWWFLGVVFLLSVASLASLARGSRGLIEERFRSPVQKGQPLLDKLLVVTLVGGIYALIAFISLDVFRLHLLGGPGPLLSALGLAAFAAGWGIVTLAMRENAFAAPVVKHMAERGQRVVDTGAYGIVRHPMYAGCIPLLVGMCLWLGSYAAALLSLALLALVVLRILVEERFLKRELSGYDAYTRKVRNRLIPFLW
jgi:protein-S-isoprenylcysteine O-methyltransferase Ste14